MEATGEMVFLLQEMQAPDAGYWKCALVEEVKQFHVGGSRLCRVRDDEKESYQITSETLHVPKERQHNLCLLNWAVEIPVK